MPGISGIVGPIFKRARGVTAQRMVAAMSHESFYRSGSMHHEAAQLEVGWVVHPQTTGHSNPVWNEEQTVCLVFTGEDFSEPMEAGLAAGQDPGASARRLLSRYEAAGLDAFLADLNGTFAGLILDLRQHQAHLFNDRFGLGRVYINEGHDGVYFASEAKAILRVAEQTRHLDPRGVADYLTCGCALDDRTLFKGISLLPQASCWTFAHGQLVRKRRYFDHREWEAQPRLSEDAFYEELKATFVRIVPRYFRGQAKVAMSLTGGLDGRMIMACSGMAPDSLPTYTFSGPVRECCDATLARRIAQACGQPHQVIPVGDNFFPRFTELAGRSVYLSDGAMDVTGSVELDVNQRARNIAPVRMTGNYGSEILRSNVAFGAHPLDPQLFCDDMLRLSEQSAIDYATAARGRAIGHITRHQVPWHHPSRLAVEQSQLIMRSPYLDNNLVALAYRAPPGQEASKTPALRFVDDLASPVSAIPTDRGLLHHPVPVLAQVHHLYQEFMFRAEYAYDYGMPPWLARIDGVIRRLHPERVFLGRHKFYHFRTWYRDQLAASVQDVLLDPRSLSRSHLRPGAVDRLVAEHLAGSHNHTTQLHQALSLELIYRQLIERKWH